MHLILLMYFYCRIFTYTFRAGNPIILSVSFLMQEYRKKKLRGLSPRANYTDRAAAAGRRSYCQLLRIEGYHVVSATDPHGR